MRRLSLGAATALLLLAAPAWADSNKPVCPGPAHNGAARCHAHVITDDTGKPLGKPRPPAPQQALTPADLQSAYGLGALSDSAGGGRTIAIVDAYHYPTAEEDLATYRTEYGLGDCTKASGCFQQVNQNGVAGSYPATNAGWAQEAALDIEMASAICPRCNIILVEANSAYLTDLGAAVKRAVTMGANVVSNSYGGGEYSSETADELAYYDNPGVAITVSSGDSGYGTEFPASSRYVTAVGGTSLKKATGTARGWTETAWSGAGSGCSRYASKPSWQTDTGCARRTVADVSAVADPATGVAVYDSTPYGGASGWLKFGGTSVAAPVVGGVYALGSFAGATGGYPSSIAYSHSSSLFDVVSGSNGRCKPNPAYLCTAGSGYDGPTGLGSPSGAAAF
jgi:subtilase family serine protease